MRSATAGRTRMAARVGSQHATACESTPKARVSRLISVAPGLERRRRIATRMS